MVLRGLARQMINNQSIWTEPRQSQAELRLTTQKWGVLHGMGSLPMSTAPQSIGPRPTIQRTIPLSVPRHMADLQDPVRNQTGGAKLPILGMGLGFPS